MDVLGKLFGSESKVRIMRLFLFNPEMSFDLESIAARAKATLSVARHEVAALRKGRFIKGRAFIKRPSRTDGAKGNGMRKKAGGWVLNPVFPYLRQLRALLIDSGLIKGDELVRKLSGAGRLKLLITAGLFNQNDDSRVDVLLVADHLRRGTLQNAMRGIEAEIGKELRYAAFETSEFRYRLSMYDKLVRDILDYPHKTVLDKIGLPPTDTASRGHTIELPREIAWAGEDR